MSCPLGPGHIVNLGKLVEDLEGKLRNTLDSVYFGKTREVVAHLRASDGVMAVDRRQSMQTSIMSEMLKRQQIGGTGSPAPGRGGGMLGGMPGGFDPKAALAGLRSTKKSESTTPPAADGGPA